MRPFITVVVCTHNRAAYARLALRSLARQSLPAEQFEVLLVDNASEDDTAELASTAAKEIPRLRYIYEGKLGLSNARNRGISEARGDIVAFLDDDAVATKDWLAAVRKSFDDNGPTTAAIAGRVYGIWEGPRPDWLADELLLHLSLLDLGERARTLSAPAVVGANMALRASALKEIGGFDVTLGRIGSNLLSGEEIKVIEALLQRGLSLRYEPDALVYHHIAADRLSKAWLRRRAFWDGVSNGVLWVSLHSPGRNQRLAQAVVGSVLLLRTSARLLMSLVLPGQRKEVQFARLCGVLGRIGYVRGLFLASPARVREAR